MYDFQQDLYQSKTQFEYIDTESPKAIGDKIKNQAFSIMDHLQGWCSHKKAGILIDIILKINPDKVLEIGVWGGKSLVPMASALKSLGKGKVYGIDPWSSQESVKYVMNDSNLAYWSHTDHEAVFQTLNKQIDRFELNDYIELIRSTSADADPIDDIDLLHIDGNHSEETSYLDVTKWVPLVRSGGYIILDDMTWYENNLFTTAKAAKWLDKHCIKLAEICEDSVWGIWVKP